MPWKSPATMNLRPATPDDLGLLRRRDAGPRRNPGWQPQLTAEHQGRAIGLIRIVDPSKEESGDWCCVSPDKRAIDLWISNEADLGRGYGTEIMKLAIRLCFGDSAVSAVLVEPRCDNEREQRFYERLGFRDVARRRIGEDESYVYKLTREDAAAGGLIG